MAYGDTLGSKGGVMGRPPGSKNKVMPRIKELARGYTDAAMEEVVRLAGLATRQSIDPKTKQPLFNADGTPKMESVPGATSEQARIAALQILFERGWGKATQMVAGDESEAPIITVTKIEVEEVLPGTPINLGDEGDQRIEH